jgi:hypothetical protein
MESINNEVLNMGALMDVTTSINVAVIHYDAPFVLLMFNSRQNWLSNRKE